MDFSSFGNAFSGPNPFNVLPGRGGWYQGIPSADNPNVGMGFGMPAGAPIYGPYSRLPGVSIGLPVERNQPQNYEPTQATRNNPNIGIGFGMPPQGGIGLNNQPQVAGPVAPNQQAASQYQPYFQQMRQGVNNLTQTLQQMENLPGQQYSGSNQNLNYFASKGTDGGI
jgi:hypothetical protein